MITETDYLILGSGIAGLTIAIKLAQRFPERSIIIVTKSNEDESNTKYAQGGIAVVTDSISDNFEKHIQDTIACGDGLCDQKVVEMVVRNGPKCLNELIYWGAHFDRTDDGSLELGIEGGHSDNRVVHFKDQTGMEIERAILAKAHQEPNIKILDYHFAVDLIIESNVCYGAYVLDEKNNTIKSLISQITILATGGVGQIYQETTNPTIATGDGIAMAIRAGAAISDMEFIQFHPTALYAPDSVSTFLISEAVRGFGGQLKTKKGVRFMFGYDNRGELASRDIVSRSIEKELKKSGDNCVYLDCTHLDMNKFRKHFPTIYQNCLLEGIDIEKDWIPVIPTQHYICGGILVNNDGQSSLKNLFACGECSRTGLHGANRLASNSLLEALVYAHRIFICLSESTLQTTTDKIAFSDYHQNGKPTNEDFITEIKKDLQYIMQQNVGIVRNDANLKRTLEKLICWKDKCTKMEQEYQCSKNFLEVKNSLEVSIAVVTFSLKRHKNKGCFFKE